MGTRRTTSLRATILTLALVFLLPAAARAESDAASAAATAFDLVILRPFGLAASALGAVFFIPAALLTAPSGRDSIEEAWDLFVGGPAEFTFTRSLGDF